MLPQATHNTGGTTGPFAAAGGIGDSIFGGITRCGTGGAGAAGAGASFDCFDSHSPQYLIPICTARPQETQ